MRVDENGEIHALNERGKTIVEALHLDALEYTHLRRRIIETISEARLGSKTLNWCLGYPDDLPNLSVEKKPKDNKRPKGIHESFFELKERCELPDYY